MWYCVQLCDTGTDSFLIAYRAYLDGLISSNFASLEWKYLSVGKQLDAIPVNLAEGMETVVGWLKQSQLRLKPSKMEFQWLEGGNTGIRSRCPGPDSMPLMPAPTGSGCLPVYGGQVTMLPG